MKYIYFLNTVLFLLSCNDTKKKELELKEKELELREKELKLDSIKIVNSNNLLVPTTSDSVSINSPVEKRTKIRVDTSVGVKKLKFPKDNLVDGYSYEFKCDDEIWGSCQLVFKKGNIVIQRKIISNSASNIYDIKLIDNKYFYFGSENYGGSNGLTTLSHYLISLKKFDIYKMDINCMADDIQSCKIKDPMKLLNDKFYYSGEENY